MCTKMPKNAIEERLRWVLPIINKEITLVDAVKVCPHGKRTLERWIAAAYREGGEEGLEPKSTRPFTNPNETPIRIKERVIEFRKSKKQYALKMMWDLEEEGISIHFQTVQKIIKTEGLTRKYRSRKSRAPYHKKHWQPGEMIEIDVKWVPERIEGDRYYQFTAIDDRARFRVLKIYDRNTEQSAMDFVNHVKQTLPDTSFCH